MTTQCITQCLLFYHADWALYRLALHWRLRPANVLLPWASAWPTLVFFVRPFSNTIEAGLLTASMAALWLLAPGLPRRLLLGSILALGLWTRFTFCLFFAPIGLALLYDVAWRATTGAPKRDLPLSPSTSSKSLQLLLLPPLGCLLQTAAATLVVASCLVAVDSLGFGSLRSSKVSQH